MSSTMMMERTGLGMPGMGVPGVGAPPVGAPTGVPQATNWMMVPRCYYKVEKCQGGIKIHCICEDKLSTSMVQNLCTMLSGGMYSCCCMFNGMTVYYCNLTLGLCKCEQTEQGVCITCTSGDPKCCEMIQACGDCLSCCLEAGCTCCFLMNSTPVCAGYSQTAQSGASKQPKTK
jgi:hypothetical protein